jgi:hypothetical protein
MYPKPERIFLVLAEGGSLSISRIQIDGLQRFLTRQQEHDFTGDGLGINTEIGYGSFEEAFETISRYPWHLLSLQMVHDDYRLVVLERLMEALNGEKGNGNYYKKRNLREHEELLSARITQDELGVWRHSVITG